MSAVGTQFKYFNFTAFMCHHNVFLLYDSIENVNQKKWDRITMFSVSVSSMILCLFGIAGYVTFTGFTQGEFSDLSKVIIYMLITPRFIVRYFLVSFLGSWDCKLYLLP